jgi:hypothetical protein
LRGRRAAVAIVIGVAVLFIGASAAEIIPAVFGFGIAPLPAALRGSSERACAEGVHRLALALERTDAGGPGCAPQAPEWRDAPAIEQVCSRSSEGRDAWAALARLRSAREQLGERPAALAPLRRDVAAHLPADLR